METEKVIMMQEKNGKYSNFEVNQIVQAEVSFQARTK